MNTVQHKTLTRENFEIEFLTEEKLTDGQCLKIFVMQSKFLMGETLML